MFGERAGLGMNRGKIALYQATYTGESRKAERELKKTKDFLMARDITDAKTKTVLADHLWLAIPRRHAKRMNPDDIFEFKARVGEYMNYREGGIRLGLKDIREVRIKRECETLSNGSFYMNEGAEVS